MNKKRWRLFGDIKKVPFSVFKERVRFNENIEKAVYRIGADYYLNLEYHVTGFRKCIDFSTGFLSYDRFTYVLRNFEPIFFKYPKAGTRKGFTLQSVAGLKNQSEGKAGSRWQSKRKICIHDYFNRFSVFPSGVICDFLCPINP